MGNTINVLIPIDTEGILKDYPTPSLVREVPLMIDKKYDLAIAISEDTVKAQEGDSLTLQAMVGDEIRFFSTSIANNHQNAVILYNMIRLMEDYQSGDTKVAPVLDNWDFVPELRSTIPLLNPELFPAAYQDTGFYRAEVASLGVEKYQLQFALYKRDAQQNLQLQGYYTWNTSITVGL